MESIGQAVPQEPAASAVSRQDFLDAMSRVATSVTVVTTAGRHGRFGSTVSAMTSVSADAPAPSLLVCLHHDSTTAKAILENGCFCVNVLDVAQAALADQFAGRTATPSPDRFSATAWSTLVTGAPVLAGTLVAFDCRLASHSRTGTHQILIGAVAGLTLGAGRSPLVYQNRGYARIVSTQPAE